MKKYLFVDLDDTLFQTPGKCAGEDDLWPAAFLKNGEVCSFTTARQRAFIAAMRREMTLIPATARNREALRRVDLPFASYAIIDYGGVVMQPDGSIDADWHESIRTEMDEALAGLLEVRSLINDFAAVAGMAGRARLIEDFSTPFYVVVKDPDKQTERLLQIERDVLVPWLEASHSGRNFYLHRNGNNLAVLPNALNKAFAVRHVLRRLEAEHGAVVTFGMGDSKSDARFMSLCDYAIVPRGTQLAAMTLETLC